VPIAVFSLVAKGELDISRVPLRRPRLTVSEAIVLNELINRSPRPVTATRLQKLLSSYSRRPYPITSEAVKQHIVNLRAKLGEVSRRPTLIITLHVNHPNGGTELAYKFAED
jgi:DNA-binding response OmpR family regulator